MPTSVPDEFAKKIAQNVAQPIFCQNECIANTVEKIAQNVGYFNIFSEKNAQSKQSQSGHPGVDKPYCPPR
jgi:hypothetical protein